jgi:hypothetical protein
MSCAAPQVQATDPSRNILFADLVLQSHAANLLGKESIQHSEVMSGRCSKVINEAVNDAQVVLSDNGS